MRAVVVAFMLFGAALADEYHRDLRDRTARPNRRPTDFAEQAEKLGPKTMVKEAEEKSSARKSRNDVEMHRGDDPCEGTCRQKSARFNQEETEPDFWRQKARAELDLALQLQKLRQKKAAKNVILFLGDGMSTASITTGRILKGQYEGMLGAEATLSMDTAEFMGFSKTYNVDAQVPDSAGTATAYLTGVKTDLGVLGLTAAVEYANCNSSKGISVQSVLMDSHAVGKSTGIVTTTRLPHATPGGAYAHSADRYWYDDTYLTDEARENGCTDIAYQLYSEAPKINVLMGGGRKYFRPSDTFDPEYADLSNHRGDGQDLIGKWEESMRKSGKNHKYVWNKEELEKVDVENIEHLWGMFEPSDMQYEVDRNVDLEPSLSEMTAKAIEILSRNDKGFYLLVEGGRIDHAHHGSNAYRAIHEVREFDRAIATAREMTSSEDTLIVVTADHGHTFTFAGYPERGVPLFGLSGTVDQAEIALDRKPWTGPLYGNGEGYQQGKQEDWSVPYERESLTPEIAGDKDYQQQSAVPRYSESHGGEDIPILASGPMSYAFHSVHQQSYIAHITRYASCVGGVTELCEELGYPTASDVTAPQQQAIEFLGYQLDQSAAEKALNALFGLEIGLFAVAIVGFVARRRKS